LASKDQLKEGKGNDWQEKEIEDNANEIAHGKRHVSGTQILVSVVRQFTVQPSKRECDLEQHRYTGQDDEHPYHHTGPDILGRGHANQMVQSVEAISSIDGIYTIDNGITALFSAHETLVEHER
jgi:hypothetical protein